MSKIVYLFLSDDIIFKSMFENNFLNTHSTYMADVDKKLSINETT